MLKDFFTVLQWLWTGIWPQLLFLYSVLTSQETSCTTGSVYPSIPLVLLLLWAPWWIYLEIWSVIGWVFYNSTIIKNQKNFYNIWREEVWQDQVLNITASIRVLKKFYFKKYSLRWKITKKNFKKHFSNLPENTETLKSVHCIKCRNFT